MAVTYEQVRQVISLSPERRRDFDVTSLLPWFQKRSYVFKNLKSKLLFDVIKNLQLIRLNQDEIVISQGEKGDCMYIILGGQVTIYNNDAKRSEDNSGSATAGPGSISSITAQSKENLRQQLGNFVITLKSGSAFGEVALMSDDCIRSATVITDVPSDLMVIDKELYNRSIKCVLKAEFDEKVNFIQANPHFNQWNAKYKKQLSMALEKETLSYENILTKQGNRIEAIYFILSGEVEVLMDPDQHSTQYPNLSPGTQNHFALEGDDLNLPRIQVNNENHKLSKKSPRKNHKIEVSLLGVNEAIGDIEVLLGLNTYMQTCICTQPTEVLVMGMKHYERLLTRRNPRTITSMKEELELRIISRMMSNSRTSEIPLLSVLKSQAESFNSTRQPSQNPNQLKKNTTTAAAASADKMMKLKKEHHVVKDKDSAVAAADPTHQNRIQAHRAGNVSQEGNKKHVLPNELKPENSQQVSSMNLSPDHLPQHVDADKIDITNINTDTVDNSGEPVVEVINVGNSDSELENLEKKISDWLTGDDTKYTSSTSYRRPDGPRIIKMHRAVTEQEQIKTGAKILIRPKKLPADIQPFNSKMENDHGKSMTVDELAYYKMALTAPVPTFEANDDGTS